MMIKKTSFTLFCALLTLSLSPLRASDTFVDYQNFNHGYCPDCNCYPCRCGEENFLDAEDPCDDEPCDECEKPDPCNPACVCGTNCGISLWVVGLVIAGVATAGALIIGSSNGIVPNH